MKKVLLAAVAALTMVAFTSCDENTEHCYEVETVYAGDTPVITYSRMTKKEAKDAEAVGTNTIAGVSLTKTTCKIAPDSKCPSED